MVAIHALSYLRDLAHPGATTHSQGVLLDTGLGVNWWVGKLRPREIH